MKKFRPAPAEFIPPMKALGVETVPTAPAGEWLCEIKFDGYRAIVVLNARQATLWSRNHKPLDYPEVMAPLEKLNCTNAVLDGEIVALDPQGRSNFQLLQGRDLGERPPLALYVFDLLHLDGESLLARPLEERRTQLGRLLRRARSPLLLSPQFSVDPGAFLAEARAKGLEGMILKQRGSLYESGARSGRWLKIKNLNEQEFVIGGFTPPRNSRVYFGSLLLGHYAGGKLLYAGKVGTGFNASLLRTVHARLTRLATPRCPFANLPLAHRSRFGQGMTPAVMRTVTWVKPSLVAQIKFAEWTNDGILRQPVFLGLRTDKPARAVRREASAATVTRSRSP